MDVEVRQPGKRQFGNGIKQTMPYKEFLDRMDAGDQTLYLTTQEAGWVGAVRDIRRFVSCKIFCFDECRGLD